MILSGSSDKDSILDAINKGAVYHYIIKPWDDKEIKVVIKQSIDYFTMQQEKRDLQKKLEEYNVCLETRVEERTRQLRAIEGPAEIGKYASQIVHNLGNPLQVILLAQGNAQRVLSKDPPDNDRLQTYMDIINKSACDMSKIIREILLHARDETNFQTEEIDINEIIKQEVAFFAFNPVFKYKIEKQVDLFDNLPSVTGNPIQIKQVIDNLIKNSIDAMENSREKVLAITTCFTDNRVVIKTSDTGCGIKEEYLSKVFSPDFTTKPVGKGTGLGLASVKTMVDSYFGDVEVTSRENEGTTFIIRIPASRKTPVTTQVDRLKAEGMKAAS